MRRWLTFGFAFLIMVAVSALALQQPGAGTHPVLDRVKKSTKTPERVALVLEMGLKDNEPRDWSGDAEITGAKVVVREGYRFRKGDQLQGNAGWSAKSHRPLRGATGPKIGVPAPVVNKMEPIATVGITWQLENVAADAKVSLRLASGEKAEVKIADLLAGKSSSLWNGQAELRRVSAAEGVALGSTEDDMPSAAYGPDGSLYVAYVSYKVREDERRIEPPYRKGQPKDFKSYYTPEFGDQVKLRRYRDGKWSEVTNVTGASESICGTAVAVDALGIVTVAYSTFRDGVQGIWTKSFAGDSFAPTKETRMSGDLPSLWPVMTTDSDGNWHLAYQAWQADGHAVIRLVSGTKAAAWQSPAGQSAWHATLAVGPNGQVALAYDSYVNGNYDVTAVVLSGGKEPVIVPLASSPKFEARPSAVYDTEGRLWIAYEEGPAKWGKDYGALAPGKGNPLYNERNVKIVCLESDGRTLKRPTAELPISSYDPPVIPFEAEKTSKYERTSRYAYPQIGVDGQGRVWISYRRNFGTRYTTHPGSYWMTYLRRLDGDHWSEPIEMHHSDGLLDHRPVLLPHASGGLLAIHNCDGRHTTPEVIDNQIYASVIDLPGKAASATLAAHDPGKNPVTEDLKSEDADVSRMRTKTVDTMAAKYHLHRGEYHRHTEISWDGAPDGSLEDMFRYALDCVRFDWIGNGDHDSGAGREYSWWLIQKFSDAYRVKDRFTTMFTYERSVPYPHGHRNVMFAQRGVRTLPRLAAGDQQPVAGVHPEDTKMLYRYLHEHGGICAMHTSATTMGTDWRDNDPVVEPIVEIYQGDRMSYEHEGAPRAGYDPKTDKLPANIAGWFPKGYINLALQQGYKLGFQASSDHWSTHISFFIILSEKNDRQSLLDAVKKRRCYGATDNIYVDWRSGDTLMGGETTGPASFRLNVIGTGPLAKVEILRDSEPMTTLKSAGNEVRADWTDPAPKAGTHYYYARIVQNDGEIAWASPIWVTSK
jgi:hypothetical protein